MPPQAGEGTPGLGGRLTRPLLCVHRILLCREGLKIASNPCKRLEFFQPRGAEVSLPSNRVTAPPMLSQQGDTSHREFTTHSWSHVLFLLYSILWKEMQISAVLCAGNSCLLDEGQANITGYPGGSALMEGSQQKIAENMDPQGEFRGLSKRRDCSDLNIPIVSKVRSKTVPLHCSVGWFYLCGLLFDIYLFFLRTRYIQRYTTETMFFLTLALVLCGREILI